MSSNIKAVLMKKEKNFFKNNKKNIENQHFRTYIKILPVLSFDLNYTDISYN